MEALKNLVPDIKKLPGRARRKVDRGDVIVFGAAKMAAFWTAEGYSGKCYRICWLCRIVRQRQHCRDRLHEYLPRRSIALSEQEVAGKVKSSETRFHRGKIRFGKLRPDLLKVETAPPEGICSAGIVAAVPRAQVRRALTIARRSSEEFADCTDRTSVSARTPRTNWKVTARCKVCLPPEHLFRANQRVSRPILDRLRANAGETATLAQTRVPMLPKFMSGEFRLQNTDAVVKEVA